MVRFSARTGWDRGESAMAAAVRAARARGEDLLDLTGSNPTACGLELAGLFGAGPVVGAEGLGYQADPLGMRSAREAVCGYYAGHGARVRAGEVCLTASTSEAYSHLFRLLCEAGDEVLVARPSYPLFDYLAELADVRLGTYPLFWDHGWWVDFAELERAIGERTRAVVVVHPNNPTGHAVGTAERARLREVCARRGVALIVDEVFLDYPVELAGEAGSYGMTGEGGALRSFAAEEAVGLQFVLSGLSKVAALPGMKVGWMVVRGADAEEAMGRLEVVADTYLSVGTPAQVGMERWMTAAPAVQARVLGRVRENLRVLREAGVEVLPVEAGWSAVVRVPRVFAEEDAAAALLGRGVVVHPGTFYGMAGVGWVVVSLLGPVEVMRAAAGRMR